MTFASYGFTPEIEDMIREITEDFAASRAERRVKRRWIAFAAAWAVVLFCVFGRFGS